MLTHYDSKIKVRGPYFNKTMGRKFVEYLDKLSNLKIRTVLYSKYLLEQHLGRELSAEETVDHIDRDKTNDVLSNLRIVNASTHSSEDQLRVKQVEILCVSCGEKALKSARHIKHNSKQGKAGPFCGKSCAGKYGAEVQNERQVVLPAQPTVEAEYYYIDKVIDSNKDKE